MPDAYQHNADDNLNADIALAEARKQNAMAAGVARFRSLGAGRESQADREEHGRRVADIDTKFHSECASIRAKHGRR